MTSKIYFFTFLFSFLSFAQAKPHHEGTLSQVNVGIRYLSLMQKRGVTLYSDFQIDPVVSLFFLNDQIEFLGDSLSYHDFFVDDAIRYRFQILNFTDNALFPNHASVRSNFFDRDDTVEVAAGLEFFLGNYDKDYWGELDITSYKDISAHQGHYLELQTKIKLTEVSIFKTRVEPHAVLRVGWGDEKNNRYYYGPTANADGVNNWAYGFWLEFPEKADRHFPIVQLMRYETLGASRRDALYAKDHNEGYLFSFIAAVGLLE